MYLASEERGHHCIQLPFALERTEHIERQRSFTAFSAQPLRLALLAEQPTKQFDVVGIRRKNVRRVIAVLVGARRDVDVVLEAAKRIFTSKVPPLSRHAAASASVPSPWAAPVSSTHAGLVRQTVAWSQLRTSISVAMPS